MVDYPSSFGWDVSDEKVKEGLAGKKLIQGQDVCQLWSGEIPRSIKEETEEEMGSLHMCRLHHRQPKWVDTST